LQKREVDLETQYTSIKREKRKGEGGRRDSIIKREREREGEIEREREGFVK
jgi:hypothetical protein